MTLRTGDVFANRFELERIAGSGGMGTVYRARDRLSGQPVALKLLNSEGDCLHKSDAERFTREAHLLSELRHSHIVAHVAHGQTPQGQRFLAMEWLDGEDLAQRLARGPLPLGEALTLIQHVAEPLAFAHQRGIVHRDLKPSNLFLLDGRLDQVTLLDFGIARRLIASRAITRNDIVIGTAEYMAPEQARGGRDLTPAADIFSLGCILYECLIGEPPFVADHPAAVLVRILFEEPVPVAQRRPGIPESVSALLASMLAKSAANRIGDAGQVAAALAAIGEVADLPLQPTLAAQPEDMPRLTDDESEQHLLSLVLVLPAQDPEAASPTLLSADALAEMERHGALLAELRSFGAQADLLLGGTLAITVQQLPSARDQAALAARCAATVRESWPEARVAVVTGRGSRSRGLLTGEVIDRAWRLLSRTPGSGRPAEPSSAEILLDEVSAGLLETRFELRPATGQGFVLGSERLEEDAARLLLGKPTPCVGRERELASLEATLSECRDEQVARAVLVLAPPGLGKSRLRQEFLRRLAARAEPVQILIGRGDPMKAESSYGLLSSALRGQCGIRDDQDLLQQQAHLRDWAIRHLDEAQVQRVTEFLGELCGLPFPDAESPQLRAARQDPRIMIDQVEQAWIDGMRAAARAQPVLLILEDLHWADALTVKLTQAALRGLSEQPFMVLALARPELQDLYPNLWAGMVQAYPLPKKAGERLARQILGPEAPSELTGRLVDQSAGNPLFLEELIRAAAERKSGEVPATVSAMIQARIGRLEVGTRRAMRAASVFGETFFENGVRRLLTATHGPDALGGGLEELIRAEIIEAQRDRRFTTEPEYRFRHALVRDAAYGLVSAEEAAAWHAEAAAFLAAAGERESVVLAEHFRLGRKKAQAIHYYVKAAEQALDVGEWGAALTCIERGLQGGAEGVQRGTLLSMQARICFFQEKFDQVLSAGHEALALLPSGSKPWCLVFEGLFSVTASTQPRALPPMIQQFLSTESEPEARPAYAFSAAGLATTMTLAGQVAMVRTIQDRIQRLSEDLAPQEYSIWGLIHAQRGLHCDFILKLPFTGLGHFENAVRAFTSSGNRQLLGLSRAYQGKALFDLRQWSTAEEVLRATLVVAEKVNDALPLSYLRLYLARLLASRPTPDSWQEAEQLCNQTIGTPVPTALGVMHAICAQIALRRSDLATAEREARVADQMMSMFLPFRPDITALLVHILLMQDRPAEAMRVCQQSLQQQQELGLAPYGILDLYVALADTQLCLRQEEGARRVVERALGELRRRVADIPEGPGAPYPEMRATYLREVPANARLLELAAQWGLGPV